MAVLYMDPESGNDANNGTSFALRFQTIANGATAARIAPGDTIRVIASLDETLVGDATWTDASKTVTLASAVNAAIDQCEVAWTASANVTSALDSSDFKQGSNSQSLAIAAGFTTGKVAYHATGALDLSGYQQVTLWVKNSAALAASTLSLRLCSDTTGDASVNTLPLPAIASTNTWFPVTIDLGGALSAAVQSVALYADLDPGTQTIKLDNITACKASSSADSLSLTSLLGKVWNRVWAASTAYSLNDIRKPTQPNRNGYRYKVTTAGTTAGSEPTWPDSIGGTVTDGSVVWTCEGLEDTWYAIQSIVGATVLLDNAVSTIATAGRGYSGTTETVATYKREPMKWPTVGGNFISGDIRDNGTAAAPITFSGGWNRTDMSTMTGETWLTGQNGLGYMIETSNANFINFNNYNGVRFGAAFSGNMNGWKITNCHVNNGGTASTAINHGSPDHFYSMVGVTFNNWAGANTGIIFDNDTFTWKARALTINNAVSSSAVGNTNGYTGFVELEDFVAKNNSAYVYNNQGAVSFKASGMVTANNASGVFGGNFRRGAVVHLYNCSMAEASIYPAFTAYRNTTIYSMRDQQTANNHLITSDGGTIISATDQRHTASGISWKFRPTSTVRGIGYPLKLSVGKIACAAGSPVTVSIWSRRDSTDIKGRLYVNGSQLPGVSSASVACEPAINTWEQSSTITFTATEAGVVEIMFEVYDGVGTTNNFWIDDLTVA